MKKIIEYVTTHVHHIAVISISLCGLIVMITPSMIGIIIFDAIIILYTIYIIATLEI